MVLRSTRNVRAIVVRAPAPPHGLPQKRVMPLAKLAVDLRQHNLGRLHRVGHGHDVQQSNAVQRAEETTVACTTRELETVVEEVAEGTSEPRAKVEVRTSRCLRGLVPTRTVRWRRGMVSRTARPRDAALVSDREVAMGPPLPQTEASSGCLDAVRQARHERDPRR